MKTFSAGHHELIFTSEMNENLGFTKKRYPSGTNLSEKSTNTANFEEVPLKWYALIDQS